MTEESIARSFKTDGTESEAATGSVPHWELLRFYETEVLKVARYGLGPKDYVMMGVYVLVGLASTVAVRTSPLGFLLAIILLALAPFALLRQTLNDRGIAFGRMLRSGSDLEHAIVATQLAKLEQFLLKRGWLSDRQVSHFCEIYQAQRADHRDGWAWIGRWMMTCVGYALSATVGAAVSMSVTGGERAFTRTMGEVALLLVIVTGLVIVVGTSLQAADRRSIRLGGLVERLRAIQVRGARD